MSIDEVAESVQRLIAYGNDDPEMSHSNIDGLVEDVVRAVAAGHPDGIRIAQEAVKLLDHEEKAEWTRWYA